MTQEDFDRQDAKEDEEFWVSFFLLRSFAFAVTGLAITNCYLQIATITP